MQYAAMKLPSKDREDDFILVDAIEASLIYQVIEKGSIDFISIQKPPEDYEKQYAQRILYGRYKPMLDHVFTIDEIKQNLNEGVNVWLAYAHSDQTGVDIRSLGIEDIVITDEILRNGDRIFIALAYTPTELNITKSHAVTAFIKYFNVDNIINNLINRKGLYAFAVKRNG